MRKKIIWPLGGGILLFSIITLACGSSSDGKSKPPTSTVPTDIQNFIEVKCSMCHFSDRVYKEKRRPQEWIKLVRRMRLLNTNWISEEDADNIADYLIKSNSKNE